MAYDVDSGDDDAAQAEAERIAATIAERRFRLRAFCDRVLDALEAIPMPETFLEADRAARAAQSCDKMVVQIHSEPKTVTESPSERAPREASVRPRRGHDDPDDDAADDEDDWRHQPIFDPETGEMLYKSYWHKALVETSSPMDGWRMRMMKVMMPPPPLRGPPPPYAALQGRMVRQRPHHQNRAGLPIRSIETP